MCVRRSRRRSGLGRIDILSLPEGLYDIPVTLIEIFAEEKLNQLVLVVPAIKRFYQRLNDRHSPVVTAGVAPGFEEMFPRKVPVAIFGCFVEMKALMYSQ